MTKVFTGNVFLTFSKETMEKFFFTNNTKSFKEKISLFTKQDIESSVIVSPYTNSNLISFDFSFGASYQNQQSLILKFAQTNSLFELWYLSRNSTDDLAQNAIRSILNSGDRNNLNKVLGKLDYQLNGNVLYFAFGVGDDIRDWAGPFVANATKHDLQIDESGIKEITLGFTVPGNLFLRNYIESKNSNNFSDSLNRYNFLLKGKNLVHRISEDIPEDDIANVQNYVTSLLSKYITGITRSPTLVFLPNLNKVYNAASNGAPTPVDVSKYENDAKKLEEMAKKAEELLKNKVAAERSSPNGRVTPFTGLSREQISELRVKAEKLRQEAKRLIANSNYKISQYGSTKKIEYKLKEAFGLKVNHKAAGRDDVIVEPDLSDNEIPITLDERIEKDFNQNKNKEKVVFSLVLESDNSGIPDSTETLIDPYVNLKYFGDSISKYSESPYDQEFFVENNIRLLKLWNEKKFTNNPNLDPVYVFGDRKLIANLLYLENITEFEEAGNYPLEDEFSSNLNKSAMVYMTSYRFDYFNLFKKGKSSSSFNENVFIRDQLALDSEAFDNIRFNGVPIFRYNIQNPNVISLNIENNVAYRNVYDLGYRLKSLAPFINVSNGRFEKFIESFSYDKFGILTKIAKDLGLYKLERFKFKELLEPVKKYLMDSPSYTRLLLEETKPVYGPLPENEISDDLLRDSSLLSYNQLAVIVTASLFQKFNPDKPFIEVDSIDEAINLESSIMENLNRLSYNLTIKTLPFFHLSTIPAGQKLAILVASENKVIGANNLGTAAFYTGLYRILGFRHFIGEGEMYSEFSLFRENISTNENTVESVNVIEDLSSRSSDVLSPIQSLVEGLNTASTIINAVNKGIDDLPNDMVKKAKTAYERITN